MKILFWSFARSLVLSGLSTLAPALANSATATSAGGEYARIKDLYEHKRYAQTLQDGQVLLTTLPRGSGDYLSLRVLVSLAAVKTQSIFNAAGLVKEAALAAPASAVAQANYGAVEMLVGDRQLAKDYFEKALHLAPADFCAQVGLAEIAALESEAGVSRAVRDLEAVNRNGLDVSQLVVLGDHFLLFKQPARALAIYQAAEAELLATDKAANSGDPSTSELPSKARLNLCIYRASLASGALDIAKKRLDEVLAAENIPVAVYLVTAQKLCQSEALAQRVYDRALALNGTDDDLFYAMGRAFGANNLDRFALLCLQRAHTQDPGDSKFAVAYAAELSKSGENVAARKDLLAVTNRARSQEPTPQRQMALGLAQTGLAILSQYQGDWALALKHTLAAQTALSYRTAYAELHAIKCHCRLLTMQYTLRTQPGVVYSFIPDDKLPVAFVIYDPKLTQAAKIWPALKGEATATPLSKSENLISFYALVQTALDYSEAPYRPLHPYFDFNGLPLRVLPES